MIPPPLVNNKRGKKTMLRRREPNEEAGYTKGKVSMKGRKITCSICGAAGHNKRFHGIEVPLQLNFYLARLQNEPGQPSDATTNDVEQSEDTANNPMDAIDPQVLEEHFQLVNNFIQT